MTFADYYAPRVFQSPYLKTTEKISGTTVLWAFLGGPLYFWRKRAPVEALILLVVDVVWFFVPDAFFGDGFFGSDEVSLLFWVVAAVGAPILLAKCYERKGWIELRPVDREGGVRRDLLLESDDPDAELDRKPIAPRAPSRRLGSKHRAF